MESINQQICGLLYEVAPTAITSVAGLRLLMEAANRAHLRRAIREHIRVKKIQSGFTEEQYLLPLVCNLALGRSDLNDIEDLRADRKLTKHIFGHSKLPSERRLSEHLASYKDSDLVGLKRVTASLLDYIPPLRDEQSGKIPLDIDSSCFEQYGTKKEEMGRHYTGAMGFNPTFAFWGRNGFALNSVLRPGNSKDMSGLKPFLEETLSLLPEHLLEQALARLDSGFYAKENIEVLHQAPSLSFVVKARLCYVLRNHVTEALEAGQMTVDPTTYGADCYGEFTYQPKGWPYLLRYVFCLQIEEKEEDGQLMLIPKRKDLILATNLPAKQFSPEKVFENYRLRGRSEQFIKELKGPLNLEQLPALSHRTNEVMLQAGLLAYNLLLLLESNWDGWVRKPGKKERRTGGQRTIGRRSLRSVQEKLLWCAATIIDHSGRITLKVADWWLEKYQPNRILEKLRSLKPPPSQTATM